MSAIVLEDLETRQIRFLRAFYSETGTQRKINLVQLGVMITKTNMSVSPLIKYRSVAKYDENLKKHYQISIVIRQNGRLEVYSDFILVNEYINPFLQCVDVDTNFNEFYFKFVKDSHTVKPTDDVNSEAFQERFEYRMVRHIWRNKISFNTSKLKKNRSCWGTVLHKRISGFFRLYTQVLNFSMFMLVSHRNMISVFDMSQGATQDA